MSLEPMNIECPCCKTVLVIDKKTGKVIEQRKPILEASESTGDRFEDARKRVESSGSRLEEKVEAAKRAEKEKLSRLDALFKERKKEIEESGEPIDKPEGIFDKL